MSKQTKLTFVYYYNKHIIVIIIIINMVIIRMDAFFIKITIISFIMYLLSDES